MCFEKRELAWFSNQLVPKTERNQHRSTMTLSNFETFLPKFALLVSDQGGTYKDTSSRQGGNT
jgi:hypothetical protein